MGPSESDRGPEPELTRDQLKLDLEIEALRSKTPWEVRKLRNELNPLTSPAFMGPLASTLITAMLALVVGLQTIQLNTRNEQLQELATFQSAAIQLGGTSAPSRAAAAAALQTYVKSGPRQREAIVLLLSALAQEQDPKALGIEANALRTAELPLLLDEAIAANRDAATALRKDGNEASRLQTPTRGGPGAGATSKVFDPDAEARAAFRAESAFQRLLVASEEASTQLARFVETPQNAAQLLEQHYSTFVRAYDPANAHVLPMFRANWLVELSRVRPETRISPDVEHRLTADVRAVAITSALASSLINLPAARSLIPARDYSNSVLVLKLQNASLHGARFDGAILAGIMDSTDLDATSFKDVEAHLLLVIGGSLNDANFLYTTISFTANAYCDGVHASSRVSLPSLKRSVFADSAVLGASPGTIAAIRATLSAGQQRGQLTFGGILGLDPSTESPDPSVQYSAWHQPPAGYSRKEIADQAVLRDAACFARGGLIDRVRPPIIVTIQ